MDLYNIALELNPAIADDKEIAEIKSRFESKYDLENIFAKFTLTKEYFDELELVLLDIAYVGNQRDIDKVRQFVRDKIKNTRRKTLYAFLQSKRQSEMSYYEKIIQCIGKTLQKYLKQSAISTDNIITQPLATEVNWDLIMYNADQLLGDDSGIHWEVLGGNRFNHQKPKSFGDSTNEKIAAFNASDLFRLSRFKI